MKIAIIGAGPAGITAAYQISKNNPTVDVYEAGPAVGGLAKTIELWNQKVDLGPHRFFSSDTRVNKLWLEVVGDDYEMVNRLTRIYYKKRFFHYPLKAFDALLNLGIFEAGHCMISYMGEKLSPTQAKEDFESWVTSRFGRRLFEVFFKTYSEKLWGISCKELDADFAAQRIKKLSLFEAIKSAMFGGGGSKHKTLVDQFAYPHQGTGVVYERMADFVKKQGGNVFLDTPAHRILTKNGKAYAIELNDGKVEEYDHIISSMPLTQMVMRLPEVPLPIKEAAKSLKFRNTILVYLNVQAKDLFPDNWLYVHSDDLKMGRLTNFRNWVPQMYGKEESSILVLEYWCYDSDDFWVMPEAELIELAKSELKQTGLIKDAGITDGFVYRIPKCYPVYSTGYKEFLKPVENYLSSIENLSVIGRYGAFKYNNQDHSILMGIMAAENILEGKKHDLWDINTDYESYQESSIITKTGLKTHA
ncbi:MAG: FAD-dependent oxidoreductase [Bacteroidetes bacterium]|nr:FAD-dependent oxidoreductase [Bacteroidota bacterium]